MDVSVVTILDNPAAGIFFNFYFNFSNYVFVYKGSLKGPTGQELFSPYSTDEEKRLFLKLNMKENVQNNSYREKPNKMQLCIKIFIITCFK
jgi:hypothetical protein